MKREPNPRALESFETACSEALAMGNAVGVPEEVQSLILLTAASALLGDRIVFERKGTRQPADMCTTLVSVSSATPLWLDVFWQAILEAGREAVLPGPLFALKPAQHTELRRNLGVLEAVGLGDSMEATMLRLSIGGRQETGGTLPNTVGSADSRRWKSARPPMSLVAIGGRQVELALPTGKPPISFASMSHEEWMRLAPKVGVEGVRRLGSMLELPRPLKAPHEEAWRSAALGFLDRLETLRRSTVWVPRIYSADSETELGALESCERTITGLADSLPAPLRAEAGFDPLLGWKITAVFSALYLDGSSSWTADGRKLFATLSTQLAVWLAERHFRLLRIAFPCDESGLFRGSELSVFRRLGDVSTSMREIQRTLKGVHARTCLSALKRAESAGLALEEFPGKWKLVPEMQRIFGPCFVYLRERIWASNWVGVW